jgi:hypothetical protein
LGEEAEEEEEEEEEEGFVCLFFSLFWMDG